MSRFLMATNQMKILACFRKWDVDAYWNNQKKIAYTVSTEPWVVLQNSGFIQWLHPTVK